MKHITVFTRFGHYLNIQKYTDAIFIALILVLSLLYNFDSIMFKPPQSIHLWRQCDCLSITTNYFEEQVPFFEPAIHNLGKDGTGKTASEFPVFYYMIAQLWKIFGKHDVIYRFIVFSLFITSLFALYRLTRFLLHDSLIAAILPLILFTSPTLVYYSTNFLMDLPAFSFGLIGLCFFFRYLHAQKNHYLWWASLFYTLAGLLKISSLLGFFGIITLFMLELIGLKFSNDKKLFQHPLKQGIPLVLTIFIVAGWYLYVYQYNISHNAGYFLFGVLPIWKMDQAQIILTFEAIREHIRWDYFRQETQYVLLLLVVLIFVFNRRFSRAMLLYLVFLFAGVILFILLFFEALKDHDYYTVNLFILVPCILLIFFMLLKGSFKKIYDSMIFRIILIIFLIHNADFARRRIQGRYDPEGWQNKTYSKIYLPYTKLGEQMRTIGIGSRDKLIMLPDKSINISLYLSGHKGWTNYGIDDDSLIIEQKIKLGARYLVIDKDNPFAEKYSRITEKSKVGESGSFEIYALHE